jgi:hypothetical protein
MNTDNKNSFSIRSEKVSRIKLIRNSEIKKRRDGNETVMDRIDKKRALNCFDKKQEVK